jgi:hypothetical protein
MLRASNHSSNQVASVPGPSPGIAEVQRECLAYKLESQGQRAYKPCSRGQYFESAFTVVLVDLLARAGLAVTP